MLSTGMVRSSAPSTIFSGRIILQNVRDVIFQRKPVNSIIRESTLSSVFIAFSPINNLRVLHNIGRIAKCFHHVAMISRYNWFGLQRRHNSVPPEATGSLRWCTSLHLTIDISIMLFWNGFVEWRNGGTADWRNGGMAWWNSGTAERL